MYTDIDNFELEYEHYTDLKNQLGFDTVWSIEGVMPLDYSLFTDLSLIHI